MLEVLSAGAVTLRYRRTLHHISVGRRYKGQHIIMLMADLDVRVINHVGELLRHFMLNPSKNYQPRRDDVVSGFIRPRNGATSHWWARGDLNPHILSNTGT